MPFILFSKWALRIHCWQKWVRYIVFHHDFTKLKWFSDYRKLKMLHSLIHLVYIVQCSCCSVFCKKQHECNVLNTVDTTKCCALQGCFNARTVATTSLLTTIFDKLSATGCNTWKCCPEQFPTVWTRRPSPVPWTRKLWISLTCLTPAMACLIGTSLCVLEKCRFGRRYGIKASSFLRKQLLPCFIHCILRAASVVQQDNKSFHCFHTLSSTHQLYLIVAVTQRKENICCVVE